MPNNKTSCSDGFSKDFYKILWDKLKDFFINSLKQIDEKDQLSISQKQAVMKQLRKKVEIKVINNLRPFLCFQC